MGQLAPQSRCPIRSLDQLMEQAACLDPLLRQKCRQLALQSRGAFLVDSTALEPQYALYEELEGGRSLPRKWLWAGIKPAARALEKLLRSYDCDASRLLDCCRQVRSGITGCSGDEWYVSVQMAV